mmetsp:Transcript_56526/g.137209  ORF Transcript_56526/g.137209 Transcript_56526/m.137209 type:complete len:91 (+) Transcript_56526:1425-1697(+)
MNASSSIVVFVVDHDDDEETMLRVSKLENVRMMKVAMHSKKIDKCTARHFIVVWWLVVLSYLNGLADDIRVYSIDCPLFTVPIQDVLCFH